MSDVLDADTAWFHLFRSMIASGTLARMNGGAIKAYLVIRSHANLHDGQSFPGMARIAELAGLSARQAIDSVQELVELGLVTKQKRGRQNIYSLQDEVQITDRRSGEVRGSASFDYRPGEVGRVVQEIRSALDSGEFSGRLVNFTLNVAIAHDQATINQGERFEQTSISFDEALSRLPESLQNAVLAARTGKKSGE